MRGIAIYDKNDVGNTLSFDLHDILSAMEDFILSRRWIISGVECTGPSAEAMHSASDGGISLSGEELMKMAAEVTQVIDGKFRGFHRTNSVSDIIIRAVDSSFFEVHSGDPKPLDRLRSRFHKIIEVGP